ncbi:MAG TPA: diacylglycerol kinase family protein [Longimicrobiales bacterium]|nr:diacylglycerol kinase family protein [Longimicrobiales bacterium]
MPAPRPAVLLNPLSGRVRRRPEAVRALAREIAGERYAEASDPLAMADAMAAFDLGEDDVLCIVAGDGTLHGALTALERQRPRGPWPTIAAAPGGTTNMAARDLGSAGGLVAWLRALRDTPGHRLTRPVLRIAVPAGEPLVGLILGAGTASEGVDFFNRRLRPLGIPEAVGSPIALVRTLLSMAAGGRNLDRMAPFMTVRVEGGPELDGPALLLGVSTLHRVVIGARPFWGGGTGPIHLTLVERSAKAIFRSVPRLILGRPGDRLTPERGWHSHDTARIEVAFDAPYIVDGELYHARAADGPLEITAAREVRWWVP